MSFSYKHFALATALFLPVAAQSEDWPKFQGNSGIGISSETGLNLADWGAGPDKLWSIEMNEGFGGAAIVGDEVFLLDREDSQIDRMVVLNLADGSEKWSYTHEYPGKLSFSGSRGTPCVEEDAIYFVGGFGHIHRINRETKKADYILSIQDLYGAEPPKWGWAQSPIISGDVMIVPAMGPDAGLVGFDKKTGKELWKTAGFGNSHSTPVMMNLHGVDQVVFIATDRTDDQELGTTISVEPKTGKVLWNTDVYFNKIPIPFPTKVTEELVFLTGGYENGSAMIRVDKDWNVEKVFDITQGTQIHPPYVIGDHIYFLANENANHKGEARKTGGLACMDFDGNIKWNTGETPFMSRGNMILVEGKLLIQDGETGYLRVVKPSPDGYNELAMTDPFGKKAEVDEMIEKQKGRDKIKLPDFKYWSPMALSNGHLIMRGQGNVVCLNLN